MNVGIVVDMDYPHVGEVRPRKLARSLRQEGHRVVIICANSRKHPAHEDLGYATIYRFDYFLNSKIYPFVSPASPMNPFWACWVTKIARQEKLDALISSNIRVALPAIFAARVLGIPMVLDLQENNAELVKHYPKTRLGHHVIRNSHLVSLLERLCIRWSDHVWVVVRERLDSAPESARHEISVVHHTPALDEVQRARQAPERNGAFTLIFIGLYAPGFGSVELILRALPYVLGHDKAVRILLGGGRQLEGLVKELGIESHVVFCGTIEPEGVTAWLRQADLGVIGYKVNEGTNTTVSVKLFQYMAAGLPVLSTAMKATRRIIQECRCGVVIPPNSTPQEVADIILQLKSSPEKLKEMGRRGRQAILEKYNWESDFRHAMRCLENLVSKNTVRRQRFSEKSSGQIPASKEYEQ